LAIETTAENCGASLFFNKKKFSDFNINLKNIHSEKLIELVKLSLSEFDTSINDLRAIAVSMGPGSFTGLRIGLAAAKGLALGADLPIIPVPTFLAVAKMVSSILPLNTEFVLLRKVNIKELYSEIYRSTEDGFIILREMEIISANDIDKFAEGRLVFTDAKTSDYLKKFPPLHASAIAEWADKEGEAINDFDYLEPNYFKKFIPKV
jgi:tRNA threonylcarbamoyladenosine biosynthesis protein TsaB